MSKTEHYRNIFNGKEADILIRLYELRNKNTLINNIIYQYVIDIEKTVFDDIIKIFEKIFNVKVEKFCFCFCNFKDKIFENDSNNFNIFILSFGWNLTLKLQSFKSYTNFDLYNGDVLHVYSNENKQCSIYVKNRFYNEYFRVFIIIFIDEQKDEFIFTEEENELLKNIISL